MARCLALLQLQAQNNAFNGSRQIALHIHILLAIFIQMSFNNNINGGFKMKNDIWNAKSLIDTDTLDSLSNSELKQVADIFNRAEQTKAGQYLMDGSLDTGESPTDDELLDTVGGDTYFKVKEVKK